MFEKWKKCPLQASGNKEKKEKNKYYLKDRKCIKVY